MGDDLRDVDHTGLSGRRELGPHPAFDLGEVDGHTDWFVDDGRQLERGAVAPTPANGAPQAR